MANWKVTFFFESLQQATFGVGSSLGWTETWFLPYNRPIDDVFAHPDVTKYVELRRACLASIYRLSFVRVTDDNHPRYTKLQALPAAFGNIKASDSKPAQVQCAVLVDFARLPLGDVANEPVHHRRFLMRGLPADIIDGNVLKTSVPEWSSIKAFLDYFGRHETGTPIPAPADVRSAMGIRYLNPAQTAKQISQANVNQLNNQLLDITAPGIIVTAGQKVRVTGVTPATQFNRIWTATADSAGTPATVIVGKTRKPMPPTLTYTGPGKGMALAVLYSYGLIDQYTVIGLRNKRTGRLFRQLRGRS